MGPREWIRSTSAEVSAGRPGSETVLAKLSELLFVEAVRRYAEALPEGQTGWLAGLRDPHVARALALLHRDIARPWTSASLAQVADMVGYHSEAAFSRAFKKAFGTAPATWRRREA